MVINLLYIHNRYDCNGNKIEEISEYEPQYTEELCEFLDEIYSSGHSDPIKKAESEFL